jgi:hypothetical protein
LYQEYAEILTLDLGAVPDYPFSITRRTVMTMKTAIAMLLGTCLLLLGCDADTKTVDSCGDGFLDPGEECDKSELGGQTCLSLGHYIDGQLSCHSDCSFDTAECGGFCGDGILETDHGELCDLFELNDQTCQTMVTVAATAADAPWATVAITPAQPMALVGREPGDGDGDGGGRDAEGVHGDGDAADHERTTTPRTSGR